MQFYLVANWRFTFNQLLSQNFSCVTCLGMKLGEHVQLIIFLYFNLQHLDRVGYLGFAQLLKLNSILYGVLGIGEWVRTHQATVNRTHEFPIFTGSTRSYINLKPVFSCFPRWERFVCRTEFVFLLIVKNLKFCIGLFRRDARLSEVLLHQSAI